MDVRTAELVRSMASAPRSPRGLGSLRDDLLRVRASLGKRGERAPLLQLAGALLDWAFDGSAAVRAQALVEIAELLAQDLGHREGPMRLYELALGLAPRDFSITSRARKVLGKDALPRVEWLYLVQSRALERLPNASEADRTQALRRLADLRAELGSVSSAIESYEKLIEHAPDLSSVRRLAELLQARGEPGDAEDAEALFALTADLGAPPRPRTTKTARLPAATLPPPRLPVYVPPLPEALAAAPLPPPPPREAIATSAPPAPRKGPETLAVDVVAEVAPAPSDDASDRVREALIRDVVIAPLPLGKAPWPMTEARIRDALDVRITQLAPGSPVPLTRRRPAQRNEPKPARHVRWLRHASVGAMSMLGVLGFMLTPLGSGLAMTLWRMHHHGGPSVEIGALETHTQTALAEPRDQGIAPLATRTDELLPLGVVAEAASGAADFRPPEAPPPLRSLLSFGGRVKRIRGGKLPVQKAQRSLERALSHASCPDGRATPAKLEVVLRISPAGRIAAVEGRAARFDCLRQALEHARFPKVRGPARVEASLVVHRTSAP